MRVSVKFALAASLLTLLVAGLVWTIVGNRNSTPYSVNRADLKGWKLITSHGEEPWMVALQPPPRLLEGLRRQASEKAGRTLPAPTRPVLPLVMRDEYADTLQGEFGIDTLVRIAEGDSIVDATFEPTCIVRRPETGSAAASDLMLIAFESPAFWQVRAHIYPEHPEIAGTGIYNPAALSPVLPLAGTDDDVERALPMRVDPLTDCEAQLVIE